MGGLRRFYWLYLLLPVGGLHRFSWHYMFFAIASGWLTSILLAFSVIASGWLAQFHLVSFSFISFTYSASGWPGCSQLVVYAVSFVVLTFPVLDRSVWAALGLKRAAPKVCVFSCWNKLRFRGERNSYFAGTGTRGLGR